VPEAAPALDLVDARIGAEEERERPEQQQGDQEQGDHASMIAGLVDKHKS